MTYLQMINWILRRLREVEVGTYNENTYSTLIGDMVNEAKREVEDAWNWNVLRTTIPITTAASTFRYTLTGAGDRYKIIYDPTTNKPDVFDDTNDQQLSMVPSGWMTRALLDNSVAYGQPLYFNINGGDGTDPYVDLFPIPNSIATINFNLVVPQGDLAASATAIKVPYYPVLLKAYALALSERGEDGGASWNEVDARAVKALSDAVALDATKQPLELIWRVE